MARLDDKGALDVLDDDSLIFLLSPLSITDTFLQSYQLLHHSQEPRLFPVSLLHIELSGSALGASKINASKISCSIYSLSPTRGGQARANQADNVAGNLHHATPSISFSGQSNMGAKSTPAACGSSAFSIDSLKAGLETVEYISCEHANLKGRVNQLEGKVGHWEKELNQIKLTLETDEEIEFMTHCSKAALDSIKE
jgi:hypothetical protein